MDNQLFESYFQETGGNSFRSIMLLVILELSLIHQWLKVSNVVEGEEFNINKKSNPSWEQ